LNSLLTESTFKITKNPLDHHVIGIYQFLTDGLCQIGSSQQMIELTDYGLDALEKNLKALLLAILTYKNKGLCNDSTLNHISRKCRCQSE